MGSGGAAPQVQGVTMTTRVVDRLAGRREQLARRSLARIVEQVPVYGRLPTEQLEGEILQVVRAAMTLLLHTMATGERPSEDVLAGLRASAVRRAEERVPLPAILGAYHVGADVAWEALQGEAGPDELDQVVAAAGAMIDLVQVLTTEVATAYVDEHRAIHSEERAADRARLEELLGPDAIRPDEWPRGSDICLAEVQLGRSDDEDDPGVEGAVASRRKVRRAEEWLHALEPAPAVAVVEDHVTIALPTDDVEATAAQLHAGLREATGVDVLVAVVLVEDEGPMHARLGAQLLAELAIEAGWHDRPVLVDDLLVPYLVARVPEVRRRAQAARDRLADGPDLLQTLSAWFAHDFDRRDTAAALHVHPNTLDHRLRRISERLGHDLSSAAGIELAATITALGDT